MGAIAPIVAGAPGAMQWFPDALKESLVGPSEREARVLTVEVQDTYQSGVGLSCVYVRTPEGAVATQGWIAGTDPGAQRPADLAEFPVASALLVVREILASGGTPPEYTRMAAGSTASRRYLLRWFNRGRLDLSSAAAMDVVEQLAFRAELLPRPPFSSSRMPGEVGGGDPVPLRGAG